MILIRIQPLRLFRQLIYRNLPNDQRKVLRVMDLLLIRLRGYDRLRSKFKLSLLVIEALIILLNPIFWLIISAVVFFGFDLRRKIIMIGQQFLGINLTNFLQWNVRCLMLKTAMNKYAIIGCPAGMTESLHRIKLKPF